jgi:2-amino-4-hydroxy-6-hydroxymethyldihydropteridine diphosphokinase
VSGDGRSGPVPAGRARPAGGGTPVTIALGSNLGNRLENLQGALDALFDAPGFALVAVSPVYLTAPVGGPAQPDYLNAVVIATTTLPAHAVLDRCHGVEAVFGRVRDEVWGPRPVDLDIIVYGDVVSDDPELILPHPRAHERAFVLAPWHDIDPDAEIPGWGQVSDLLAKIGPAEIRRLDDAVLHLPA